MTKRRRQIGEVGVVPSHQQTLVFDGRFQKSPGIAACELLFTRVDRTNALGLQFTHQGDGKSSVEKKPDQERDPPASLRLRLIMRSISAGNAAA